MPLTQQRLREVLNYDQHTGSWTWREAKAHRIRPGQLAGSWGEDGYLLICIDGKKYQASRLAFLWMTGSWPVHDAEHRDGDPSHNQWENLRDATVSQNMQNKSIQSNNESGLKGVSKHSLGGVWTGKWRARIKPQSQSVIHLGLFDCPAAAHLAYVVAAQIHFGEFARAN